MIDACSSKELYRTVFSSHDLNPADIGSGSFHSVPRYYMPALTSRMA
jgi:hypothetical protein